MLNPLLYTTQFFFVSGTVLFVLMAYRYALKEKGYDERQLLLTYKSYKYSALVAWAWCLFFGFFRFEAYTMLQTTLYTSLATHLCFRILHHSLSPRGKSDTLLMILIGFLMALIPLHLWAGNNLKPLTTEEYFNGLMFLTCYASILTCMLIRRNRDKQEEEEE